MTASAAVRRTSRSGDISCDSPCSRLTSVASPSTGMVTVIADVSSENSRTHALFAVSALSERMRSSGSLSRCGR